MVRYKPPHVLHSKAAKYTNTDDSGALTDFLGKQKQVVNNRQFEHKHTE